MPLAETLRALAVLGAACVASCGVYEPRLIHHASQQELSLEQFRGKVVMINYWATWCGPCMKEIPLLLDLAERYRGRVVVLAVFYERENPGRKIVDEWLAKNPKAFTPHIYYGTAGFHWTYPSNGALPTTYVLDARGQQVEMVRGLLAPERARALIENALAHAPVVSVATAAPRE